ncbi:MAG: hypothetical protein CVU89_14195 [Firmicutes bacterium HGW-Firmicutes-14]|nr:MAG: hypothetical protein CVU89_14195 [Firmicutes bacterium HGW-Firmicutes-14]
MAAKNMPKYTYGFLVIAALALTAAVAWMIFGRSGPAVKLKHNTLNEKDPPVYLGEIKVPDNKKPIWVYVYEENLFVSYTEEENIDIFSLTGEKLRELRAKITKSEGAPQGMLKTSRGMLVADYQNGGIGFFADNGRLLDAYYVTADNRPIKPVSAAVYNDVLYITDVNINGWLAVLQDGEMIMEIKGDDEKKRMEFPYGIAVTGDGRVIVTDPAGGRVKVFNCAGWYAFDLPASELGMKNPQGVIIDGLGRIHLVDNGSGYVFVFDNSGNYLFKYGEGLKNPSNIAADRENRVIYIANTEDESISIWGY